VVEAADGCYTYRGRRDRMVKRRGYRVELGEIEAGLYRHPAVKEAAVVAVPDESLGVRITAFLSCRGGKRLADRDEALLRRAPAAVHDPGPVFLAGALPKTSTDKTDYQRLKEMA
jgi:acyl-coenzyme A synthetase/AMP-(fatty) acid ligase